MELPIGKISTWVKRRPGYETPGHPGGGLVGRFWVGWLLGLVLLGYPGGGSTGRYWVGGLLGLVPLGLLGWAGWLGEPSLGSWYRINHYKYLIEKKIYYLYIITLAIKLNKVLQTIKTAFHR